MPVRDEAATIERCLRSVLEQDYPEDLLEVIVADGMSSDATRAIVQEVAQELARIAVKLIDNPGRITPAGLNAALRVARGEVIVRVDGHCLIAKDYVSRCVEALERTGADIVGGAQRANTEPGSGVVARAIVTAVTSPFGTGSADYRHADREGWVETVYLGAFRREIFDRVGAFDEDLARTEDGELNLRVTQAGGRIWLDRDIEVKYFPRQTLGSLWRQYYEYGLYKVRFMQKRRAPGALRQFVPPVFVIGLAAGGLAALATRRRAWIVSIAGPYLAANFAATLHASRRELIGLTVLPVVFATIHTAWGLGFWVGLLRSLRREP